MRALVTAESRTQCSHPSRGKIRQEEFRSQLYGPGNEHSEPTGNGRLLVAHAYLTQSDT